jgi:thiol-disulfide isomerase/thioredoxin
MKPIFPYRYLHLLVPLLLISGFTRLSAQSARLTVYDSLPQLENRIKQAGDATLVINFWATWCKPCIEELPCFEQLRVRYADQNVQVLLVSLDFKSHIEKKLIPFLKSQKFQSEIVLLADQDVNTWIPRMYEDWDGAIPATLVIKGDQRQFKLGQFQKYTDLETFVRPFVTNTSRAGVSASQNLFDCSCK